MGNYALEISYKYYCTGLLNITYMIYQASRWIYSFQEIQLIFKCESLICFPAQRNELLQRNEINLERYTLLL